MSAISAKKTGELLLVLLGAFTEEGPQALQRDLESLSGADVDRIILNLASVTYFSQLYAEKLVNLHQKLLAEGKSLIIQRANEEVRRQLATIQADPPLQFLS